MDSDSSQEESDNRNNRNAQQQVQPQHVPRWENNRGGDENSDVSDDENFSRGAKSIDSPPESPPRGGGNLDSPPASPPRTESPTPPHSPDSPESDDHENDNVEDEPIRIRPISPASSAGSRNSRSSFRRSPLRRMTPDSPDSWRSRSRSVRSRSAKSSDDECARSRSRSSSSSPRRVPSNENRRLSSSIRRNDTNDDDGDGRSDISSGSSIGSSRSSSSNRPVVESVNNLNNKPSMLDIKSHTEDLSEISDEDSEDGIGCADNDDENPKEAQHNSGGESPDKPQPPESIENKGDGEKEINLETEQLDFEAEEREERKDVKDEQEKSEDSEKDKNLDKNSKADSDEGKAKEDLEEGELTDEDENRPEETEPRPICRFFSRGQCTWGSSCSSLHSDNKETNENSILINEDLVDVPLNPSSIVAIATPQRVFNRFRHYRPYFHRFVYPRSFQKSRFLHPGVSDKGNYTMFEMVRPLVPMNQTPHPIPPPHIFHGGVPPSHHLEFHRAAIHHHPHIERTAAVAAPPPNRKEDASGTESAWERGLRQAKEMIKKSSKRKESDTDFEEKKLNLSAQEDIDKENEFYARPQSPFVEENFVERFPFKEERRYRERELRERLDFDPVIHAVAFYQTRHHFDGIRGGRGGGMIGGGVHIPYDDAIEGRPRYRPHHYAQLEHDDELPHHPHYHRRIPYDEHHRYERHPPSMNHHYRERINPPEEYYDKKRHKYVREPIDDKSWKDESPRVRRSGSYERRDPTISGLHGNVPSGVSKTNVKAPDDWADPWMRSKSPPRQKVRRKSSYTSSRSSYSSSSSSHSSSYSSYSKTRSNSRSSRSSSRSTSGSPRMLPNRKMMKRKLSPPVRGKATSPPAQESRVFMNPPAPSPSRASKVSTPPSERERKRGISAKILAAAMHSRSSSSSHSESSATGTSSDESSSESSSSSRSQSPSPQPKQNRNNMKKLVDQNLAQAMKVKAMDALKVSGQKQPIKLNLKARESNMKKSNSPPLKAIPSRKRAAESPPFEPDGPKNKKLVPPTRREELLKQLKAVEDAIARKRSKV